MRSQKQPLKKTKTSAMRGDQSSQQQDSEKNVGSQQIDGGDLQENAQMEEMVKMEESGVNYATKQKKQIKFQKRIQKLYAQNNFISQPSPPSPPQLQQELDLLRPFLLAHWGKLYIDYISGSYWRENSSSLPEQLMLLDITPNIVNQLQIQVKDHIQKLIQDTRTQMQQYFIPHQGVYVNTTIFSKKGLSNTCCRINNQEQKPMLKKQTLLFSFCPSRLVTGKIFYRLAFEECGDTIMYGRRGIGKTTSAMLYILLSEHIHRYEGLHQNNIQIDGNYKKLLYWSVQTISYMDVLGQKLKIIRNLILVLKLQCSQQNLSPRPVNTSIAMSLEDYQFETFNNLCEEISIHYKNPYIFVDEFDVMVSAVRESNKKLDELLKVGKQQKFQQKLQALKSKIQNNGIILKECEVSAFYIKILQTFRNNKIDLIFNSSTNIEEQYLRNYPINLQDLYHYLPLGTSQRSYQKIKIEYQQYKKEWIIEEMTHVFKFWMNYKLSIQPPAINRQQKFVPIDYLKEYQKEVRKKMGNKKMIDVPTPVIVFDAISASTPFLHEELTVKQKFAQKCEQMIKLMGAKLKHQLRQMFNSIGTSSMNQQSKLINIQLIQQYFNVPDENSLISSFSEVFKNAKGFKAQQTQIESMLDLGTYTINTKDVVCNIKGKHFRREFVNFLVTVPTGLGEQIIYKLMETLPKSENGICLQDCFMMGLEVTCSFYSSQLEFTVGKKMGFGQLPDSKFWLKKELKQIVEHLSNKEQQTVLALAFKNELYQQYNQLESEQDRNKCFTKNKLSNQSYCDCILIQKSHLKQIWNFIIISAKSKKSRIQERFSKLMKIISKVEEFNPVEGTASTLIVRVFLMIRPNIINESKMLAKLKRKTQEKIGRIVQNLGSIVVPLEQTRIDMPQTNLHGIAYNWIIQNKQVIEFEERMDPRNQPDDEERESSYSQD